MHAAGPRALQSSSAATVARRFASPSRRSFHRSSRRTQKNPADNSSAPEAGKPSGKSESEYQGTSSKSENAPADVTPEATTRRVRSSTFSASRQRPARARVSDDLPPVQLPRSFIESSVQSHDPSRRSSVLADDPIWHRGYIGAQWHDWLWQDLEVVLDAASWDPEGLKRALNDLRNSNFDVVSRQSDVLGETARWLKLCLSEKWSPVFTQRPSEMDVPKELSIAFLEAKNTSPIVSAILSPERKADTRRDIGFTTREGRRKVASDDTFLRSRVVKHIRQVSGGTDGESPRPDNSGAATSDTTTPSMSTLEFHGSRIFDNKLLGELTAAVRAELALTPDERFARRDLKRPLVVVHIPNYSGRYPTRKLFQRIAAHVEADLLRLDAQDFASIVGGYLGQDTAYSKGSMSMLAYRVAEMNGRLTKGVEAPGSGDDDMSGEIEAAWVNIRQHASSGSFKSPMEEELQKIKDGPRDYVLPSVDRWENLKINAALEQMLHAALGESSDPKRPLIVQCDNFVELNMTLEGALLLGRLRGVIDTMWREGKKIILAGSSASEDPSDQYTSALAEVASEECLIPSPLQLQRIPSGELKKAHRESMDYIQENLRNIQIMLKAIGGEADSEPITRPANGDAAFNFNAHLAGPGASSRIVSTLLRETDGEGINTNLYPSSFTSSVLSCPDVYHIARSFHGAQFDDQVKTTDVVKYFFDVIKFRSISASAGQNESSEDKQASAKPQASSKQKAEPERMSNGGKYNDFEKKLLTGLVDVNEIRTTFDDVHAPKDTITALRLLTSLSLVRPEAFTYGILANDKIPGCLLYGPPGTGKTLLAKAVAKESGASMLEVSGASINDMYVGQSEKNVRALFSLAKKLSPLVIFIDEADALFAARGQSRSRPSHRETINQFLREWDGMSDTKAFIMVATNRPFDLDDAVLRRLPRKILVDLPLAADRAAILRILLKDERLDDSVSVDDISRRTVLYSGSDLKNLCVAAAMAAVQEELEDAKRHEGPEPYVYPEKRTLARRHFDKAAGEIAASISEDMDSLKAIRKFDQKYGDQRSRSRKPKTMGFGVIPGAVDAEDARVRQPDVA